MSKRQRGWNKHEAVILLDGYLEALNGKMSRQESVERVSNDLRRMAKNQGEEIDESFRNENGISFQMYRMESAYKGYTISISATKLFSDVVELYNTNRTEYIKLLEEARAMINKELSCETEFMTWLSKKVSPAQLSELYWCYSEIETACLNANILNKPLFETTDIDTIEAVGQYIEKNKLFRIKHMRQFYKIVSAEHCYYKFIKEKAEKEMTENNSFSQPEVNETEDKVVETAADENNFSDLTKETNIEESIDEASQNVDEAKPLEPVIKQEAQEYETEISKEDELTQRVRNALKADSERNSYGTTLYFLLQQADTTKRKEVQQILADAEWAKYIYGRYYYVGETLEVNSDEKKVENEAKGTDKLTEDLVKTSEDKRLLAKYPVIYRRVFYALRDSLNQTTGVTVGDMQRITKRIGRASDIEEILDNASWSESLNGKYRFRRKRDFATEQHEENHESKEKVVKTKGINKEEVLAQEERTVDFKNPSGYAHTRPASFYYFEEKKDIGKSWTDLYVSFFATLYDDYPDRFTPGMSFSVKKERIELDYKNKSDEMFAPKEIPGTDLVIETNISADNMVNKMRHLLDICAVDYENVVIRYCRKSNTKDRVVVHAKEEKEESVQKEIVSRMSFRKYLEEKKGLTEATSRSYASAVNVCETFAKNHGYTKWRLYIFNLAEVREIVKLLFSDEEFAKYNARWHNQLRAAISYLLEFLGDDSGTDAIMQPLKRVPEEREKYCNENYEKILRNKFQRGYRLDSIIELRKFKQYYEDMIGMEIEDSDDQIDNNIRRLCIQCDGRAYLPEMMLSEELKDTLFKYIEKCFDAGKTNIYYQALCTEFAEDFIDYPLHNNPEALKAYLSEVGSEIFCINRTCISKEPNASIDPLEELRECMKEFGRPVKYEEIFAALPHLPQSKIKFLLSANEEFVSNGTGIYFHESAVHISDEELENIGAIVEHTIEEKNFIGGNELYDAIKMMYPYIIEENPEFSVYGFRDALKYKLGGRFSFKGNIISALDEELSMSDVFANYAEQHDSFTLTELENLAHELATSIYFDEIYDNSLRISREQFVSKERAQFNVLDVDAAIDIMCTGDYIAIKQVNNFAIFPYVGFPWNSFLLEHYVYAYSEKYMLLHSGFNRVNCVGAIVKRSANISSFDDFVVALLKDEGVELAKDAVLQMLVDEGYLVNRRYSNIEEILIRAKAQRNRKETD